VVDDAEVQLAGRYAVKQVLLIQDYALVRESLALLLEWQLGLESVEAGSLAEGRRVLSDLEGVADFATIIGLDLPDGDGSKLIEQLHETKPEVRILALTADRSVVRRARVFSRSSPSVIQISTSSVSAVMGVQRSPGDAPWQGTLLVRNRTHLGRDPVSEVASAYEGATPSAIYSPSAILRHQESPLAFDASGAPGRT
jgi:CheY-like chemotaxis protein